MGQIVLHVDHAKRRLRKVRVYAHCANSGNKLYKPGDIVFLIINLSNCTSVVSIKNKKLVHSNRDMYWLQPDPEVGLQSK